MTTQTIGWASGDGTLHPTKEEAMGHDLCLLLKPEIGKSIAINGPATAEDLAQYLVRERAKILEALQWKEDPKLPKPRKPRSDKGKRKAAPSILYPEGAKP